MSNCKHRLNMAPNLLERWLSQRVGYCVWVNARDAGQTLYDGKVYYDLLKSYGLVDLAMFGGIPGRGKKSADEAYKWLVQLCDAFRFLNIDVDEKYLREVANRNGPYAVRLLYQLFMKLEDKSFINLLAPEKSSAIVHQTKELLIRQQKKCGVRTLTRELLSSGPAMAQQYDNAKRRIVQYCADEMGKRRQKDRAAQQYVHFTLEELGSPNILAKLEATEDEDEEPMMFDSGEFIEALKMRSRLKLNEEHKLWKQLMKPDELSSDSLDDGGGGDGPDKPKASKGSRRKSKSRRGSRRSSKARKSRTARRSSGTSKNTAPRKSATGRKSLAGRRGSKARKSSAGRRGSKARKSSAGRRGSKGHKKSKKQSEPSEEPEIVEEVGSEHIVKNLILRMGGEEIGRQQECVWRLHARLYSEQTKLRKQGNFEMSRHVVQDILDIVMKMLLYRYETKRAPIPRRVMNDWKDAFFKEELTLPPIPLPTSDSLPGELDIELTGESESEHQGLQDYDSEVHIDREVVRMLNEYNLHCYMYLVGDWELPEGNVEEESLTVNGFIVHRLLQAKYPLPKRYQDPEFDFKYTAGLSSIKDSNTAYIYSTIRNLMTKQEVVVIDIIEPMNYCLNTYHVEMASIEEVESAKNEPPPPKSRKSKASGRKSKTPRGSKAGGGRKSKTARQSKTPRKSSSGTKSSADKKQASTTGKNKPSSQKSSTSSKTTKKIREKAVQCPSVDMMIPRVNHSTAGLLGKEAFATINSGRAVSDLLSGKMLIEFLKTKKGVAKGFALLSYPLNVSQAVLLDFLMTGRPIKTDYKVSEEIAKFIHDELRPQPYVDTRLLVNFDESFNLDEMELRRTLGTNFDAECPSYFENNTGHEAPTNWVRIGDDGGNDEYTDKGNLQPYQDARETNTPNEAFLNNNELVEDLRTNAYNLDRLRPMLSAEAYEKMKTHVFGLMRWLRLKRKYGKTTSGPQKPPTCLEEVIDESGEVAEIEGELDGKGNLRFDPNKLPVTYTQLLKLRASEIMPRPNRDEMEIHYSSASFFSKYIKCATSSDAKKEEENYAARKLKYEEYLNKDPPSQEFVLDPIVEAEPDSYFKSYGKKEVFSYSSLDYDSVTRLCRMIIDEPWDEADGARKDSRLLFDRDTLKKLMKDFPGKSRKKGKGSGSSSRRGSKKGSRKSTSGRKKSVKRGSKVSKRSSKVSRRSSKRQSTRRKSTGTKTKKKSTPPKDELPKENVVEEEIVEVEEEEEEENLVTIKPAPTIYPPPPPPPVPGENGWEYLEEHIPNVFQIYLATVWENVEFEYLWNLLHTLFFMRVHNYTVIPYRNFIRNEMELALLKSDNRMEEVDAFQNEINNIKPKSRKSCNHKRSLQCRIFNIYNELVGFADSKRNAALARRVELLEQRWAAKHLFTMANQYAGLIQVETNRTIESLQLMHDYYFAMLQKPPSADRLALFQIPKIFLPSRDVSSMTLEDSGHKSLLPWEKPEEQVQVPEFVLKTLNGINSFLADPSVKSISPNPTYTLTTKAIELASVKADELYDLYELTILDYELGKELRPKIKKKLSAEEEKERKKQERAFRKMLERKKHKKTRDRSSSSDHDSKPRRIRKKRVRVELGEYDEEEEEEDGQPKAKFYIDSRKLHMVDRLKWEWLVAVQCEVKRLKFRLELIQKRAESDADEVLSILKAGFDEFFHDIGWQYRREISSIDRIISVFKTSVQTGYQIPSLLFEPSGRYYLHQYPSGEEFPVVSPPTNTPLRTLPDNFVFTMRQLNNIVRKIEDVSPTGSLDGCFVDILEDMVAHGDDWEYEFLPSGWAELTRNDLRFLVNQAFGSNSVVNWRDFLLFCTGLRYPTIEEIIDMRTRFREMDDFGLENVSYSLYKDILLWYENDLVTEEEQNWGREIKELLFKLFRTSRKEINYTELLLTLCKGKAPEEGFGKALSLTLGVGYIFWPDPPEWVRPRQVIDQILNQLLHDVILKTEFIYVTELPKEEERKIEETNVVEEPEVEIENEEWFEDEEFFMGEEVGEEVEVEKYIWRTCVPFKACLALLFAALRFWDLPESNIRRQIEVESQLKELFFRQGVGSHLKAYKLVQSDLIRNIFQNTSAFKACNIPELVYCIVQSKYHVIGARNVLETTL